MDLETGWVTHDGPGGSVSAYLARPRPAHGPVPGIIVIQEIWGVDEHIRDVAERLATAGYAALAPDLYSAPAGRRTELSFERVKASKEFMNSVPVSEWSNVLGDQARRQRELGALPDDQAAQVDETIGVLFGAVGRDTGIHVEVLRASFAFLRAHEAVGGRAVGSIGFCMGGNLSARLASVESELAAATIFYGHSLSAEEVASIHCPIRGFYGADDTPIASGLPAFDRALSDAGVDHELRAYPDTGHAFFNDGRPTYRHVAARDAWARTLAFFAATLEPAPTV